MPLRACDVSASVVRSLLAHDMTDCQSRLVVDKEILMDTDIPPRADMANLVLKKKKTMEIANCYKYKKNII